MLHNQKDQEHLKCEGTTPSSEKENYKRDTNGKEVKFVRLLM